MSTIPTPTPSLSFSISHNLRPTKKIPQDVIFDEYVQSDESRHVGGLKFGFVGSRRPQKRLRLDKRTRWAHGLRLTRVVFQFDVPEDVFEVLRLALSWENSSAPINRIPPEIFSTIPDFLGTGDGMIALTHVSRAWRQMFVSRPSLWTDFECVNPDKTRVYLERSKSSPIDLWLKRGDKMSPRDPVLQVIPHATGRLKSLYIDATSEYIKAISARLSCPTPLLERLSIQSDYRTVLAPTLFNGDLSSLRRLRLEYFPTELPWRNMVNLTSFVLAYEGPVLVGQLLDFFESAPHLHEIDLLFGCWFPRGAQDERLVQLTCLKKMYVEGYPSSLLFNHLLIPVGARLRMTVGAPPVEVVPPRFMDNLGNLSDFTSIKLDYARMEFSGPNGEVVMIQNPTYPSILFKSLVSINTSGTERLEIKRGWGPTSIPLYRVLIPMNELRTLIFTRCENIHDLIDALHTRMSSPGVVLCPRLEELVIDHHKMFTIEKTVGMAAARASKGARLKTVRIIIPPGAVHPQLDTSELKKHVSHVELRYTRQ